MKPGYYIDWADDLMIVYPDGAYDFYNTQKGKYEKYQVRDGELYPTNDYKFICELI